jgi:hypothetical protein
MSRLCIVPCGNAKIWDKEPKAGPTEAQHVYTGVFATACQRYAKAFFNDWIILSAKHGFLFPEEVVNESYNVSFIKPSNETITLQDLKEQAEWKGLYDYHEITVLGGKHYVDRVKMIFEQGQTINLPLDDCKGIGYMLQKLTRSIEEGIEIVSNALYRRVEYITTPTQQPQKQIGKYNPLLEYLSPHDGTMLEMTIEKIEMILGFRLPASAHLHRPWWGNTITNSQAKAWLLAGWEVHCVELKKAVIFRKT